MVTIPLRMETPEQIAVNILEKANRNTVACFNLVNAASFSNLASNREYLRAIKNSNFNFVDGKPLSLYLRLLFFVPQVQSRGMDILKRALELQTSNPNSNLFVYFERPNNMQLHKYVLNFLDADHMLTLEIDDCLELEEIAELIIAKSKKLNSAIIWLMIGSPRQEILSHLISGRINNPIVGIGGVIDFITGSTKEAPHIIQFFYLEWLFRFLQEPRRLFSRYTSGNIIFIKALAFDLFVHIKNTLVKKRKFVSTENRIYVNIKC